LDQNDQNLVDIFIEESREHLTGIEDDLLAIEECASGTESNELNDKVFRAIHTIKGSSGFFGLTTIKNLSHGMENILGNIRSGSLRPEPDIISVLLECADTLKLLINNIVESNDVPIEHLLEQLQNIAAQSVDIVPELPDALTINPTAETVRYISPVFEVSIEVAPEALVHAQLKYPGRFFYIVEIDTARDALAQLKSTNELFDEIGAIADIIAYKDLVLDEQPLHRHMAMICSTSLLKSVFSELLQLPQERIQKIDLSTEMLPHLPPAVNPLPKASEQEATSVVTHRTKKNLHPAEIQITKTVTTQGTRPVAVQKNSASAHFDKSLRVNIMTLDRLMTLAGEMVLTRNELLQNISSRNMVLIHSTSQKVDAITSELQEAIMSTRMLSVGVVLSRFRRFSRDIAMQLGKELSLDIRGEEVELDKTIVEAIGDPLTHIVRNAIDHGIETPEVRIRAGKDPAGTLQIAASHEAGHVLIEIMDDGRGIDPVRIRAKAKSTGLCDDATLAAMSDDETIKLIFRPGFSTAETVTDLSGRGVGMDVVQNNLKRIGGSIDISSVNGLGTTLRIKLPLTLAIIPALLIRVEDERYAIPQGVIEELVRIPAADVKFRLESIGGASVLRLRGELLPLVKLSEVLGISTTFIEPPTGNIRSDRRKIIHDRRGAADDASGGMFDKRSRTDRRKSHTSALNIVVVAAGEFKYGIIASQLLDSAEIVVKPLGYHLNECREYAGATILGDGHVALILDVIGIRHYLELKTIATSFSHVKDNPPQKREADTQSFLVVENGTAEFFAIPVGLISRIDRIATSSIAQSGGKQVIHYRGTTLRVLSIEDIISVKERCRSTSTYLIIMQASGREIGLLASDIVDTIDIPDSEVDCITHVQPGVIGSVFIKDALTLIIDLFGMVKKGAPELLAPIVDHHKEPKNGKILIVEDSAFFRQQICSFIEDAGYETVCRENGAQGLAFLKEGKIDIDIILTDIEMPEMNGLDFTKAVRADKQLKHIPIIAITSVTGETAEKKGREAGIDAYLIKFERQSVLSTCTQFIQQNKHKEHV